MTYMVLVAFVAVFIIAVVVVLFKVERKNSAFLITHILRDESYAGKKPKKKH